MHTPSRAEQALVALLLCAFLGSTALWSDHPWRLAPLGGSTIAGAWFLARRLGPAAEPKEALGVFLAAFLLIGFPPTFDPPIHAGTWASIGLGILGTEAAWAVWRFPATPKSAPPLGSALAESLGTGVLMAIAYSLFAAVILLLAGKATGDASVLGTLVIGYFVAGLAAGVIVALLRRLTASPLGTMLIGILSGICVYGAVSPAAEMSERSEGKPPTSVQEQIGIAVACGILAGPPAALMIRGRSVA